MIVVIDNYDSFTYNLVQYLGELGAQTVVFRNDEVTVDQVTSLSPSHLVISPGPGTPDRDGGISNDLIRAFHRQIPILGVCLGHQCIAHVFGGRVDRAERLMHGKVSRILHQGDPLFSGIPTSFEATRYHSLIVYDPLPPSLRPLARTTEGELMALKHQKYPTYGVQFHPESILTPHGKRLLSNFIQLPREIEGVGLSKASQALEMRHVLERVLAGEHLDSDEAEAVMSLIMSGQATPAQIAALLTALRAKGETVAEITGFARGMRAHATQVKTSRQPLVDTCGTGGDGTHTFNISTTTALVVAGAGVAVAKHGNRSVSSQCGSADVLMALGVNLELTPEQVGRCIDEVGFGFLYAPKLHPAMRFAIGPRREMGIRTVFNILGPLTNPASASRQVLGVFHRDWLDPLAYVLRELGTEAAFIVHSEDGADELMTTGPNHVAQLSQGKISRFLLNPEAFGLRRVPLEALRGGDASENAAITRRVLEGERSPHRDVVLLNAGVALVAAGIASDIKEGILRAAEAIDSGQALQVLDQLIAFTQEAA